MNWIYGGGAGAVFAICLLLFLAIEDEIPRPPNDWLKRWPFGEDGNP